MRMNVGEVCEHGRPYGVRCSICDPIEPGSVYLGAGVWSDPAPKPPPDELRSTVADLAMMLTEAEQKAGKAELFKTMHAINEAKSALGWEGAEKLEAQGTRDG